MEAMEAARRQVGGKTSCDCKGSEAMEANIPPLRNVERGWRQSVSNLEASRRQVGARLPLRCNRSEAMEPLSPFIYRGVRGIGNRSAVCVVGAEVLTFASIASGASENTHSTPLTDPLNWVMQQTVVEQKRPRGDKSTGNLARIERDLKAYELHLAGVTVRGVCDELGIKSTQTAFNAINRGRDYCIERGIPTEERRIEIDRMFKETLGLLAQTAREQAINGQEEFYVDQDGRKSMKRRKGVDPRIAGELSRSLNRWAEFCGLLERAPEVNTASTTLIQLAAPTNGAVFDTRWAGEAEPATIDVSPTADGDNMLAIEAGCQQALSPVLEGVVEQGSLDLAHSPAHNVDSSPSGARIGRRQVR